MATILIATMDSRVYDALSSEVMGEGHDVLWANSGQDAIEMVLSPGADFVFAEEALPIFDGFEMVEMLRADPDVPRELPVFLLGDEAVEPHRFERSGFTGHFPKSHSFCDVRELLSAYIRPDWATP